jgi:DNA polymerase III subunit beta
MYFDIERDLFFEGLSKTVPITEKRSTLPILSHILLKASDSKLVLTATDLEVGLQMIYNCNIKQEGVVTIPAKKIHEIIRELPTGNLEVELQENRRIKITSGESVFELAGMDGSEYPAWPAVEEVETAAIKSEDLVYMIDKTLFASSNDDSRFNLNGVLFEKNEDNTRLVATDGHRLALMNAEVSLPIETKILLPKKSLGELKRLLENVKEEVLVGFEPKNMILKTDKFLMTLRLIDGDYPDYRKVLPAEGEKIVKASRAKLLQALRRVAILTADRNKGINLLVSQNKIEVTSTHPDLGTAKDSIEAEYNSDEFTVIVNVTYMIEALGVIDSETVSLQFLQEGAPILIRPEPGKSYFNLVMPMRK